MPFKQLKIKGNIFDDGDGDGNVNGTAINSADSEQLYVTLLDDSGNVLASKPVANDGTYEFDGIDGVAPAHTYSVVLSTKENATSSTLPANWRNSGENINSLGNGNDGTVDGIIEVPVVDKDVIQVDLGINRQPEAEDKIIDKEDAIINTGGDSQYQVPALVTHDNEDGTPTTITIVELPDPKDGVLYYDGVPVTKGQVIENYDPKKLTIDPTEGNPTVVFKFTTTDVDGFESEPKRVEIPFMGYMYVGDKVWFDRNGNGIQDDGEPGIAGVTVKLYSKDGQLLQTTETNTTGGYEFEIHTPGEFYVEFENKYTYTNMHSGSDNSVDSDVINHGNKTETFAMDWGDRDMGIDAGVVSSIGNFVWYDKNLNGLQDSGEPGVVATVVSITDSNGKAVKDVYGNVLKDVKTDANGYYYFKGVNPSGTYIIKVHLPSSYMATTQDSGNDLLDSDANSNGEITVVHPQFNNYSFDTGIYCECDDYKVNPDSKTKSSSAPVLNIFGLLLFISSIVLIARKED